MLRPAPGRSAARSIALALALAACHDGSTSPRTAPEPPDPTRVVTISRAASGADTIDARFIGGLQVTVRDGKGRPVADAAVRVQWSSPAAAGPVTFAPIGSPIFASPVLLATDAQGVATTSLELGRALGTGVITATETSTLAKDSVAISVGPGAFFRSTVVVKDTAMLVGGMIAVSGGAFDRLDNPLPLTFSSTGTACSLGIDGVIRGVSPGACQVSVSQPAGASFRVTVVAASTMLETGVAGLSTVRLDGTQRNVFLPGAGYYNCVWMPDGTALVCPNGSQLVRVGMNGTVTPIPIAGVVEIRLVRVSQDSNWLVFNGYPGPTPTWGNTTLYRARIDGSQLQPLLPACCSLIVPSFDVSGDGSVVFYSNYSTRRLVVATGATSVVKQARESLARFSPDGTMVAYLDGLEVWLSNPDGSNMRILYTSPRPDVGPYFQHLEWSPDSKWLMTIGYGDRPFLIAADGSATLRVELPSIRSYKP